MKFNCGLSKETKRRLQLSYLQNWHPVFAWFPVRISDNDCRWLEYVEVRYPEAFIGVASGDIYRLSQEVRSRK